MTSISNNTLFSPIEKWYDEHSDTLDELTTLTLATTLLAAEIFKNIPKVIPRSARALLGGTGILSLKFQCKELSKHWRDLKLAWEAEEWSSISLTALKVAVKVSDIFLTIGSFTFACVSLAGYPALTLSYYAFVKPLATGTWGLIIAFDVIDLLHIRTLSHTLATITRHEDREEISQYFKWILTKENASPPHVTSQNKKIARDLARQYDHYRLKELEKESNKEFFSLLVDNLKIRQNVNTAELSLKALGYISLGINRVYPETLIQASSYWGMSVLYTTLHFYNKYHASFRLC